jgi:Tol biopolymer transport system component
MKREISQGISALVLVAFLSACVTVSSSDRPEAEQPSEIHLTEVSTTALPTTSTQLSLGSLTGEIAYLSNRTGIAEVWLLDLASGLQRQLTQTDCSDAPYSGGYVPERFVSGVQGFSWAPDGRKIAYLTTCTYPNQQSRIDVHNLENNSIISVTNKADAYSYPSWSPSGDQVMFSVPPDDSVYIAEVKENDVFRAELITRTFCAFPTWSPDGSHIAYRGPEVGLPGVGSRTYISIVDTEWNHLAYEPPPVPIADYPNIRDGVWIAAPSHDGLTWSGDGRYLAVATEREYVSGSLTLVEVVDRTVFRYSGLGPVDPFGPDFYSPAFSPGDTALYFVSTWPDAEYGWPFGTIYRVSTQDLLSGEPSQEVSVVSPEDQLAGFPSLSANGDWLVYAVKVGETTEVWIRELDGAYYQQLVSDGFVNTQPTWRPE